MKHFQRGFTLWELLLVFVGLAALYGWINNIVILVHTSFDTPLTVEVGLRIVGVLALPLGIVMGYL